MWIPEHLRDRAGQWATIGAAVAVFAMQAVPTFFPRLFGLERAVFAFTTLLPVTLVAVSLLDRFRPSRWFLLVTLPFAWIFLAGGFAADYRASLVFQVCCATLAWVLLNAAPVREYFGAGHSWAERFFLRRAERGELAPGGTARAWGDRESRDLEPVGGGSREPAPSWWVNP